jgi:hypothetical protein
LIDGLPKQKVRKIVDTTVSIYHVRGKSEILIVRQGKKIRERTKGRENLCGESGTF